MANINSNFDCFKTRPIGDIFHLVENKVFLQVSPENEIGSCTGCYFQGTGYSCTKYKDIMGDCGPRRDDNIFVIFKKVEPQMELEPCSGCHKDNCNECIVFNQDSLEQEKIISKEKSLEEQVSFLVGLLTERQLDEFTSFLNK